VPTTVGFSNPSGDQKTWVVTFSGSGVVGGSIADGVYDITLNEADVTAVSGGGTLANNRTDTFYRLTGDALGYSANGSKADVSNTDLSLFKLALNKAPGQTGYKAYFDFLGAGLDSISNSDLSIFKLRLNKTYTGFSPTI